MISFVHSLGSAAKELVETANWKLVTAAELRTAVVGRAGYERGQALWSLHKDEMGLSRAVAGYQRNDKALKKAFANLSPLLRTEAERRLASRIEQFMPAWDRDHRRFEELLQEGKADEAATWLRQTILPTYDPAANAANELLDMQVASLASQMIENKQVVGSANTLAWILLVVGLAANGLLFYGMVGASRQLQDISQSLGEGAQQIASASSEISRGSGDLAQSASQQAASLEETAASSNEIAAITRQNAESSRRAAELMHRVSGEVQQGNQRIEEMMTSMNDINTASDKISKIIRVIDEIAFQTNILALNAAVEAARAGEAGMGFAVVAEEVRNLAQRSAVAAKDTAIMIEDTIGASADGSDKLKRVGDVIHAITTSSASVQRLVDEVSAASQEQARGIEQILRALTQMDRMTQSTAASAQESASASEGLSQQARTVKDVVKRLQEMVGA
jgi:methyl-accepting chemotaxis protein